MGNHDTARPVPSSPDQGRDKAELLRKHVTDLRARGHNVTVLGAAQDGTGTTHE